MQFIFQNAGTGIAYRLDRARALNGAGAAHEIYWHRCHRHCLRLNYANRMTPAIEAAVKCIGETVAQQLKACAKLNPAAETAQDEP